MVNVPVYVVSFALTPEEVRAWDWRAFWGSEVTAAVGNGLGGFGSGVAGVVTGRMNPVLVRARVVGGVVEYSWAVGSGYVGLFVGAGVSESSVSWGSVVYYGGFNIANNYMLSKINYNALREHNVPVLKNVNPVYIESYTSASLAGISDIIKTLGDGYIPKMNVGISRSGSSQEGVGVHE